MSPGRFHQIANDLPGCTVDIKWQSTRVYSVGAKMFAAVSLHDPVQPFYSFKTSDMAFDLLIENGLARPAPYLARAKWVRIVEGGLSDDEIARYVSAAHALVVAKLPHKARPG